MDPRRLCSCNSFAGLSHSGMRRVGEYSSSWSVYPFHQIFRTRYWPTARVSPEHLAVATALAALRWNWHGERRESALVAGLGVESLRRLSELDPDDRQPGLVLGTVDQGLMEVRRRAAEELVPIRPDLVPVVAAAMRHSSLGTVEALELDLGRKRIRDTSQGSI